MLTKEDNEIVNHVGPGTLMGNLLRRYWTPALLSEELPEPDCNPVRVRMLAEDLVAFRDTQGRVGLVDSCCPHRGTGMFFGRNEENGLRCVYHGWKYDVTGQCVDMPSEPENSNYKERLKIPAYPTYESGGIVWTYMGPKDKMTGFRDFGTENLPREKWRAWKRFEPMTFMQSQEGSFDTTHTSWVHMFGAAKDIDANADGSDTPGAFNSGEALWKFWSYDRAPRVEVVEDWFGFRGAGLRRTPNGNTHARLYSFCIPYTKGHQQGAFCVPIDDDSGVSAFYFDTVNTEMQHALPVGKSGNASPVYPYVLDGLERNLQNDYLINREKQKDGTIYTGLEHFRSQDIMARQTAFQDRTKEHLGSLDRKVILMRRTLINAAKNLARGIEPPAIDPALPYDRIGQPDRCLLPDEDWTRIGTELDPNYHRLWASAAALAEPPALATQR